MGKKIYITNDYTKNHTKFSGLIYPLDFETDYCNGRNYASRIMSDLKFDEYCKKNIIKREQGKFTESNESNVFDL